MTTMKRLAIGLVVALVGQQAAFAQETVIGAGVTPGFSSAGAFGFSVKATLDYTVAPLVQNLSIKIGTKLEYSITGNAFNGELKSPIEYTLPLLQGDLTVSAAARVTPKVAFSTAFALSLKPEVGFKFGGSVAPGVFAFAELFGGSDIGLVGGNVITLTIEFSTGLYMKPLPELEFIPVLFTGFGQAVSGANFNYTYLGLDLGFNYALAPNLTFNAKPTVETNLNFSSFNFKVFLGIQYKL
jgi:hypothetical protein